MSFRLSAQYLLTQYCDGPPTDILLTKAYKYMLTYSTNPKTNLTFH